MPPDKQGAPPGGSGTPEKNVEFAGFDCPTDKPQPRKKQARPRRRSHRKLIPIGPIAAEIVANRKFQRQVERVHALGPRVTAELLAEIGAERGITSIIDSKLNTYAGLDPKAIEATGGDGFWPLPLHEIRRTPC